MTAQLQLITIAGLQNQLDLLERGQTLSIAGATYRRLFGVNHVAWNRLTHFAQGHGCFARQHDDNVVFHKRG